MRRMFGVLCRIVAAPGQGDALARHLVAGMRECTGCVSFPVNADRGGADLLWSTQLWESREDYERSLGRQSDRQRSARDLGLLVEVGTPVVGLRAN